MGYKIRALGETEFFKRALNTPANKIKLDTAIKSLSNNIGVVSVSSHLDLNLIEMRKNTSYYPLTNKIIERTLKTNAIVPFFFTHDTGSIVDPKLPFIFTRQNTENRVGSGGTVYVNLFGGSGNWTADKLSFKITTPELYTYLEGGLIMYSLLFEPHVGQKITENTTIMEMSTRIYSELFIKILEKSSSKIIDKTDIKYSMMKFLISKFFLKYVMGKPEGTLVDQIAYNTLPKMVAPTFNVVKELEQGFDIDYSMLSSFLDSLEQEIYGTQTRMILNFTNKWMKTYGEKTALMMEYFPYFLFFVFSGLGNRFGISNLGSHIKNIQNDAMKLYLEIKLSM